MLDQLSRQISIIAGLRKASPVAYMGPDRQLYVDPEHTQAWHPDYSQHSHARIQAMAEMARADADRQRLNPKHLVSKYYYDVLKEKGVQIHPSVDNSTPPPQPAQPRGKAFFHSTPASNMASIKAHGLLAARGGRTWGGQYENHSRGKVFLSSTPEAARQWHRKTADAMESKLVGRQQLGKNPVVMLRVKDRPVQADTMPGGLLGAESHFTTSDIPPEDLEFYHGKAKRWMPIKSWRPGAHGLPEEEEDEHYFPPGLQKSAMADLEARRRVYSNQDMTALGADGHYPHAIKATIPVDQIGGLEPVPAPSDDEGYRPGRQIKVPIEVEYLPDIEPGKNLALAGGNHRLHQAKVNGQTHIEAFVHHPEGKYATLRARLKGLGAL